MIINERLKLLRFRANYTQEYIASVLNVDYTTYGKYESGKSQLRIDQAAKLAKLYNVSLDELYFGSESTSVISQKDKRTDKTLKLTVELDGKSDTLEHWILKLKEINKLV